MMASEKDEECQECKQSLEQVPVSFCMVFPFVLLQKALPDDLSLSLMQFPSS